MTTHAAHAHPGHGQLSPQREAELADLLDLDAALLGDYLDEATAWAADQLPGQPRMVVDLGAGTGVGTLALARRFPTAAVVAVDRSRVMLDRVVRSAGEQGLAERVSVVQADVDEGWPALTGADLVWASSSLHELADPARTLRDVFAALVPGGVLVVVEMDSLPRFLPPEDADLERRVLGALEAAGWNSHPDWTRHLETAGFEVVGRRALPTQAAGAGRYADTYLRRMRVALEQRMSADDLAVLDRLLDGPGSLLARPDVTVRGSRTAWAARRP